MEYQSMFLSYLDATQNWNECLNSIVWSILPKTKNYGYRSIRCAGALACLYFNEGRSGLEFFKHIDIDVNDELITTILGKQCTVANCCEHSYAIIL